MSFGFDDCMASLFSVLVLGAFGLYYSIQQSKEIRDLKYRLDEIRRRTK
jgi:hypothetical protein